MVCTPLCNPFPVYYHYTLKLLYSIAHTVPHGAGRLHPRNPHILRPRPHPGYPAPNLTTTSLSSHVICTDPQLLIEERPEAYKSIQDDVEEKRTAEGVCVEAFCDMQGWESDGKRVECQGTLTYFRTPVRRGAAVSGIRFSSS